MSRRISIGLLVGLSAVGLLGVVSLRAQYTRPTAAHPKPANVQLVSLAENPYWPPWCMPPQNGKNFTIDMIDNLPDLHGDIVNPQLVIYFAGNQFMVVPDLLKAFCAEHPEIKRIFAETLPPGIEADQIEKGALIIGNCRIAMGCPDVYTGGKGRIEELQKSKKWFSRIEHYARNRLAIMVPKGNPADIHSLKDLGSKTLLVSMPNPKWEGIGKRILEAYKKAGGNALVRTIMTDKVQEGTTFLTHIHHRQTPLRILLGMSQAGPVWYTEAKFQQTLGHPIQLVTIPDSENVTAVYTAAMFRKAPHRTAAKKFMDFLVSEKGQAVYKKYGFEPPPK